MAITISGVNDNDKITASDGTLDLVSGGNYAGIITAPAFSASGNLTASSINVGSNIQFGNAGIITATTLVGNVTGNINHTSNLLLQISGSEKFRVGTSGQLGIGGANYGTSGQVLTSGGSGSAATWSTVDTDKITEGNTEAEVVDTGSDGHFKVTTEGTERLRINSSGQLLVGATGNSTGGIAEFSKSVGGGGAGCHITVENTSNNSVNNTAGIHLKTDTGTAKFFKYQANQTFLQSASGGASELILQASGAHPMRLYTNSNERLRIDSTGRLLAGAGAIANPKSSGAGSIDLDNQAFTIIVGGNHPSGGRSDNNAKTFRMSMVHNTLAEEPINILQGYCDSSDNNLYIGGGTGAANSLTQVRVYTGTNTTTTGGTERIRINNAGAIGLSGANYGSSGQVLTSQGSGSAVAWSTVSGTTINNNADNRVITGSGTANTLNGESNFTVDSNGAVTIAPSSAGVTQTLRSNGTTYGGAISLINTQSSDYRWDIAVGGGDNAYVSGRGLLLRSVTDSKNVAAFQTDGDVLIHDGDLKVASGHGIDFSATADGTGSSQAEILDDYEEGSWTPAVNSGNASFSTMTGRYTKVGNKVTLFVKISGGSGYSGSSALQISGLPFANNTAVHPIGNAEYYKIDFSRDYTSHCTPYIAGNNLQWLRNASGGGSGNYLTVNLFYTGASINTSITYNTNS